MPEQFDVPSPILRIRSELQPDVVELTGLLEPSERGGEVKSIGRTLD
jgi:hypothetical protein